MSDASSRLQGLQRENVRLQEQLRSSKELNASLHSELDLHRSIMAQTSFHQEDQGHGQDGFGPQTHARNRDGDMDDMQKTASGQPHMINSGEKLGWSSC